MSPNLCDLMQFNSRSNATSSMVESRGFSGAPGYSESTKNKNIDAFPLPSASQILQLQLRIFFSSISFYNICHTFPEWKGEIVTLPCKGKSCKMALLPKEQNQPKSGTRRTPFVFSQGGSLYKSMPHQMKAVIDANGNHTNYWDEFYLYSTNMSNE